MKKNEMIYINKSNIFYFIADISALINKRIRNEAVRNSYDQNTHEELISYFTDYIHNKIQNYTFKNEKKNASYELHFKRIKNEMLFCAVCLIDDTFIHQSPLTKEFWVKDNLEKRIYGTQSAGDKFFTYIEECIVELQSNETSERIVYETHYLLLHIFNTTLKAGFRGKILADKEELKNIQNRIHEILEISEDITLPTVKSNFSRYTPPFFKSILTELNGNFFFYNLLVAFLFLVLNTLIWEFQSFQILNIFR